MKSKIYTGIIEHRRFSPVPHRLKYPLYMYALDLDELERLDQQFPFFGHNRFNLTSIHDKDYLAGGNQPIRRKLEKILQENGSTGPVETVMLVTSARYLNYVFNPVSFYYCLDRENRLIAVVAEVSNTYGERHSYVLDQPMQPAGQYPAKYSSQKVFHVSPFNRVEGTYEFFFSELSESLDIRIVLFRNSEKIMEARLTASGSDMTPGAHIRTVLRHPWVPHLSMPRIYAEALKLYFLKKLTFHPKPVPVSAATRPRTKPGWMEKVCLKLFADAVDRAKGGPLTLVLPDKRSRVFGTRDAADPVRIEAKDFRLFTRTVFQGDIGLGESYVSGEWETPDLVGLFRFFVVNRDALNDGGWAVSLASRIRERLAHKRLKNTRNNTRKNISDHYDLGNDFYTLFLDRRMLYSCAIFESETESLEKAQENKLDAVIRKADIGPSDHVLEIGCGWGGFAVYAAQKTGCRVTGITVSKAQFEYASALAQQEGVSDRVEFRLQDYRDCSGRYDRIVSIEMIEAVGKEFMAGFFRKCSELLKDGGTMVLQSIILPDDRYEAYCRQRDWIQKHIFPGGHLPCVRVLRETADLHTDFTVQAVDHIGPHYAATLRHWRHRFCSNRTALESLGVDETFFRKWTYYLSICEAGFAGRALEDVHLVLTRP